MEPARARAKRAGCGGWVEVPKSPKGNRGRDRGCIPARPLAVLQAVQARFCVPSGPCCGWRWPIGETACATSSTPRAGAATIPPVSPPRLDTPPAPPARNPPDRRQMLSSEAVTCLWTPYFHDAYALHVQNGRAVDQVDAAQVKVAAIDAQQSHSGQADGIGPVRRARGEQAPSLARAARRAHDRRPSATAMKPTEDPDAFDSDEVSERAGGNSLRVHLQDRLGIRIYGRRLLGRTKTPLIG